MSVTCRTVVYPLFKEGIGMVKFEHDPDSRMVTIWFLPWGAADMAIATWNGLTINKSPHTFISSVAREVWEDLVQQGFNAP